ncbi:MAG: tetratricopeptide repeat protein [Candidatus Poribacteria bacterium]
MKRVFLPYLWFIIVTSVFCNIAVPSWSFVSAGDGTRYTLKTLDAVTEDVKRADDGSYLIHADITIANRSSPDVLKIAPGAVLKFAPGVELRINGILISSGKKNNPIRFTSQNVKRWGGIVFDDVQGGNSIIKYSLVENARNGILVDSSDVTIVQNELRQMFSAAISFWNSSDGSVVGNTISESNIGVYCRESNPKIEDNELTGLNVGIFVKDSFPSTIKGNVISNSRNAAIILTDGSKSTIESNRLIDNRRGITCNDSDPMIKGNSISGGEYGIYCEESSPRIAGNKILNSKRAGIVVGLMSNPIIKENTITGKGYGVLSSAETAHPILIDNIEIPLTEWTHADSQRLSAGANVERPKADAPKAGKTPIEQKAGLQSAKIVPGSAIHRLNKARNELRYYKLTKNADEASLPADTFHQASTTFSAGQNRTKSGDLSALANIETSKAGISKREKPSSEERKARKSIPISEERPKPFKRMSKGKIRQLESAIKNPNSTPNERIEARFELGRLYFKAGNYRKALSFYDAIIKQFAGKKKRKSVKRELANVHYHRGLTYYQLGRYAKAIDDCNLSMRLNPTPDVQLRAQYILAMSYLNMPDSPKQMAEQAFAEALKFNPKDEEGQEIVASAYLQLGRLAMKREDYRDAAPKFRKAVEYFQKFQKKKNASQMTEAIADVAYCYLQLKDYRTALNWYERLVSTAQGEDNLLATGHLAIGDIYARDKKWADAEKNYRIAIRYAGENWDDKSRGDTYFKWGESLLASEKQRQARDAYREALQLNPDAKWVADASYNIGEISFEMRDYKDAINAYQQAIAGYESALGELEDGELIARAKTRIALAKFQLAEAYASEDYNAPRPEAEYRRILRAYQDARRASSSLTDEELRRSIEKDSLYGEAIFWQKLGERKRAVETASQLAEIANSTNDATALSQAADILFEAANNDGNYHKAAEVYERALRVWRESQKPTDAEYLRLMARLGFCHLRMGEDATAEMRDELLRQAVGNYDAVLAEAESGEWMEGWKFPAELLDNVRYHKAVAHKLLGEYDAAAKLFEAVIASQSKTTSADLDEASLLPLAEIYEKERRYDDAIQTYEKAYNSLTEPKDKAFSLQKLGELSRQRGRYDDAIRYYRELVSRYAQSEFATPAQYFIALSYSRKPAAREDDLKKACAAYETFIQNHPSSELAPDAHWNLASLYNRLGQKAKAMEICKKIIERYQSSKSETRISSVVDAAQNMLSNILIEKMDAPHLSTGGARGGLSAADAEMLRTQLEQIIASPTQAPDAKADAHFELGNLHLRAENYRAALAEYDSAMGESPKDELLTKIYYHKTLAHYELNEYPDVIATCKEALKLNPNLRTKAHLMYLLGVSYQASGQESEAETAFKTAIQLTQGGADFDKAKQINAQSHLYLGDIYNQRGRLAEAEEEYRRAAESDIPAIQAEAYHQMARLYELRPSDSAADEKIIEMYGNVLTVSDDDVLTAEALYKRGLAHARQSQTEAAVADFEALTKRFADTHDGEIQAMVEDATFRLSNIYGRQGDVDSAIEKAKSVENIAGQSGKPDVLAQAQYQLASLYRKKAQTYERGSRTHRQLTSQASRLYRSAYENANAVSDKDETLREISNVASFQSGQLAYQLDKFDDAIEALSYFTENFPNDPKSLAGWNYLAWSYYQSAGEQKSNKRRRQRFIHAADAFEKLFQNFSADERAAEWLYQAGQALTEAGEYDRAIAVYRRLADRYPTHKLADAALYSAANAFRAAEQYDDAIETYRELLSKYPESDWADEAGYAVGICYDRLKRLDEALAAYQAVIGKFKDSPLAANAQANIAHYYFNRKNYVRALEEYKKLTRANFPTIDAKLSSDAKTWIKDTENVLAESIYRQAVAAMSKAEEKSPRPPLVNGEDKISQEQRKKHAKDALALFKRIIEKYPQSVYADNAAVSLGAAYEILGEWDEAIASYKIILQRYPKTPPTKEIVTLIAYAQERIKVIKTYLWQKEKFD